MRLGSKAYLLLVYTVGAVVVTVRAVPAGDDAVIAGVAPDLLARTIVSSDAKIGARSGGLG